jgi:hypothetical protein
VSTIVADPRIGLISPLSPGPKETTAATGPVCRAWDAIIDQLEQLGSLAGDWDGQGADPPSPANLSAAVAWVNRMRAWNSAICPTKVVSGTGGEVHVVWQTAEVYLDAEIASPGSAEWLLSVPGKPTRQWRTDLSQPWLVGLIG